MTTTLPFRDSFPGPGRLPSAFSGLRFSSPTVLFVHPFPSLRRSFRSPQSSHRFPSSTHSHTAICIIPSAIDRPACTPQDATRTTSLLSARRVHSFCFLPPPSNVSPISSQNNLRE
ncbi:hypothetical protein L596_026133 [Steinernema carpocapsae]|uniref:Uncharacterized protein n=1 Tax=Steinernema carpocapsae TaxID=34508 RepID=A0A4U5M0F9_STECR|nr:hypothetical protein L596_026133 [Steinernema carpocapsae]